MNKRRTLSSAAVALRTDPSRLPMFVGSRQMLIRDAAQGVSFPAVVLYPTDEPSRPTAFGPFAMDVSCDALVAQGLFPLVVVSHGTSGSHLLYRTIGTHLAKNGYVVAMLEHPGNNRNNNELEGTHENLVNRPRHVRLTIDALIADARFSACLRQNMVALLGHSLGGYTALAVAGGTPWSEARKKVEVVADARIRALVLLAPAAAFYLPEDSLRHVKVPILMLVAEHDAFTPRWHTDVVRDRVPDPAQLTSRVVENAGHFSFLSPFPPQMKTPGFLPSTDPAGFDREKFHQQLPAEVLDFLDRSLKDS